VLPIAGRPVIATLLRELASAGFDEVAVVTGHLAEQTETLLGDGAGFGLRIRYARQPEPLGSADAVRCAFEAGVRPPLLVLAADTPSAALRSNFRIDQAALVTAVGAVLGGLAGLALDRVTRRPAHATTSSASANPA
jgi:NDP-sugar pyrophosphorylase family protein